MQKVICLDSMLVRDATVSVCPNCERLDCSVWMEEFDAYLDAVMA